MKVLRKKGEKENAMSMLGSIGVSVESRCTSHIIVGAMLVDSAQARKQEKEVTEQAIEAYTQHAEFCRRFFKTHQYNPGGWCAVFEVKNKAAQLEAEAVKIEVLTLIEQQWLSVSWNSDNWIKIFLAELRKEKDYLYNYYSARFERWEDWNRNGSGLHRAIEDKNLEFVIHRTRQIQKEITLIKTLENFGRELREGKNPDPNSPHAEANRILALFYKARLEAL